MTRTARARAELVGVIWSGRSDDRCSEVGIHHRTAARLFRRPKAEISTPLSLPPVRRSICRRSGPSPAFESSARARHRGCGGSLHGPRRSGRSARRRLPSPSIGVQYRRIETQKRTIRCGWCGIAADFQGCCAAAPSDPSCRPKCHRRRTSAAGSHTLRTSGWRYGPRKPPAEHRANRTPGRAPPPRTCGIAAVVRPRGAIEGAGAHR